MGAFLFNIKEKYFYIIEIKNIHRVSLTYYKNTTIS